MYYMGDSEWWDNRFKARGLKVMSHERILEEDLKYFPKEGKVLDIACGDGRNAIYLAEAGYEVMAVDFSEEALKRLDYFIQGKDLKIETKELDLSSEEALESLDKFEIIIINHYRLKPELYAKLMQHISDGGVLWVNGFMEEPKDNPKITSTDILRNEDFSLLSRYELVDRKVYEIGERKFIRGIWRKIVME